MDTGEAARVRRVIDGDTIELDRPDPTGTYLFERVRLINITAPELDAKSPEERALARKAQRFLRTLVVRRDVLLFGEGRDKFHRRLARVEVLIDGEPHDVERLLVADGVAQWWRDVLRERTDRQRRLGGLQHAKSGR